VARQRFAAFLHLARIERKSEKSAEKSASRAGLSVLY
jgi:hypothetical protein